MLTFLCNLMHFILSISKTFWPKGTKKLRTSACAWALSVDAGVPGVLRGRHRLLHLSRLEEIAVQTQLGSPSSAQVAPRGARAITKLRNCLLEPSPPKNAWLLSGCLYLDFPRVGKSAIPNTFPCLCHRVS